MPDISKIALPSGTVYNIKDEEARSAIAGLSSFDYIVCNSAANTPKDVVWNNGSATVTGTLVASASTKGKIYLVPSTNGEKDIFDEYVTVNPTTDVYSWEMFGNTDVHLSDLGALAKKDSASGSYTPEGTVSAPTITVTPNIVTKYVANSATGGGSITPGQAAECSLPTLGMTVSNETLNIAWTPGSFTANTPTAVTLPAFEGQSVVTGIQGATASQPTFSGTAKSVSVS